MKIAARRRLAVGALATSTAVIAGLLIGPALAAPNGLTITPSGVVNSNAAAELTFNTTDADLTTGGTATFTRIGSTGVGFTVTIDENPIDPSESTGTKDFTDVDGAGRRHERRRHGRAGGRRHLRRQRRRGRVARPAGRRRQRHVRLLLHRPGRGTAGRQLDRAEQPPTRRCGQRLDPRQQLRARYAHRGPVPGRRRRRRRHDEPAAAERQRHAGHRQHHHPHGDPPPLPGRVRCPARHPQPPRDEPRRHHRAVQRLLLRRRGAPHRQRAERREQRPRTRPSRRSPSTAPTSPTARRGSSSSGRPAPPAASSCRSSAPTSGTTPAPRSPPTSTCATPPPVTTPTSPSCRARAAS